MEPKGEGMETGQLSEHFWRSEFECRCGCGFDTVDAELVRVLEDERAYFCRKYGRARIKITGPNRCPKHNRAEGGAEDSKHTTARAADHKAYYLGPNGRTWLKVPAKEQADYLESKYPDCYGIGRYHNRVHLDTRKEKARWTA